MLYRRASRLFAELATARGEGRLSRLMATLERTRLLIIDDWGPEPLTAEQRRDLLEIVDDRYEKGSLLITSQIPIGRWHEVIADHTIGDAILDRVIHRAHRLELKGPSMRKRHNAEVSATDRLDERQGEVRRNQPSVASPRCSGMPLVSVIRLATSATRGSLPCEKYAPARTRGKINDPDTPFSMPSAATSASGVRSRFASFSGHGRPTPSIGGRYGR